MASKLIESIEMIHGVTRPNIRIVFSVATAEKIDDPAELRLPSDGVRK
jgi:hypothetical protein